MSAASDSPRSRRTRDGCSRRDRDFALPAELEAGEPPEARGLRRDEVRLLVSDVARDSIEHARFHDLPRWLSPGDLLVVNTSGTLNAALAGRRCGMADSFELHLSTRLPGGFWTVEVRQLQDGGVAAVPRRRVPAQRFRLPAGGQAHAARALSARRRRSNRRRACGSRRVQLPGPVLGVSRAATAVRFATAT